MVCFQNSRNRSSTAREEPAVRRINDVNPRNGSATSLANSQSSPFPRSPPSLPPGNPPSLSLSRRFRAFPLLSPQEPTLFCSGPTPTRPEEPQARPGRWTFALSCRLYARFVARRLHVLTTPPSYHPYSSSSPLPVSLHASSASTTVASSLGILPTEFRNNRLTRRRSSRSRQDGA